MANPEEEKKKKEEEGLDEKVEKEAEKLPETPKKEEPKEPKEPSKLEKIIGKTFDFVYHGAIAAASTAIGLATAGTAAPIIGGAFAGAGLLGSFFSKKEKPSLYERVLSAFRTYSVVNAILGPMISLGNATFPLIDNSTLLGKAARTAFAVGPYNAAFITAYKSGDHLIKNKFDFTGIGASIKDNFWPMYKRFAIGFAPGYALIANGINSLNILGYKAPTFAVNAAPLGLYNGVNPPGYKPKKTEEPKEKPKPDYKKELVTQPG